MKQIFFLIFITCLCSCSKQKCKTGVPQLWLYDFSDKDLELIKVEEFESDGTFSKVKKTIYLGTSISKQSEDSIPQIGMALNVPAYYRIKILNSGTVYKIHDIYFANSSVRKSPIGGEFHGCRDAYSYKVNNTVINADLEVFNSTVSGVWAMPVKIEKNKVY